MHHARHTERKEILEESKTIEFIFKKIVGKIITKNFLKYIFRMEANFQVVFSE